MQNKDVGIYLKGILAFQYLIWTYLSSIASDIFLVILWYHYV